MRPNSPPRFIVRTMVATLAVLALVLACAFVMVALSVRNRVHGAVSAKLEAGQRIVTALEERRARELQAQVAMLAESPSLKTALTAYTIANATKALDLTAGRAVWRPVEAVPVGKLTQAQVARYSRIYDARQDAQSALSIEIERVATRTNADVLALTDTSGTVVAVAGRHRSEWPHDAMTRARRDGLGDAYLALPSGAFQVGSAPIAAKNVSLGTLHLATALDDRFAQEIATLAGVGTLIVSGRRAVGSSIPEAARLLTEPMVADLPNRDIVRLGDSEYTVRPLFLAGDAAVYALDSIEASTRAPVRSALQTLFMIALGSFVLAAGASFWLARTIANPIGTLSQSMTAMTRTRDFENLLPPTGKTQEEESLTAAFNSMMRAVNAAELETRSAYLGAIRALALALDARDPYTAGHSERVSAVSIAIGRRMQLPDDQIEILGLGALLHDIGKIGVSDAVLRKTAALTPDEFELIKQHPAMGARILRSVPFLAAHIPIVELHHERPDGRGYPHRLKGDQVPLLARIVHVADAFDAMTSARAYRPARSAQEALRELWRCAGWQFDTQVVEALESTLPAALDVPVPSFPDALSLPHPRLAVMQARGRA